jgi:uncharacterized membrane protein
MQVRIRKIWEDIRTSYWFFPSLMAAVSIMLSQVTIEMDRAGLLAEIGLIWGGSPDGARAVLETVASSMITVAGVTFSIVIVALSVATSQFGSRLLRNFMADTSNQIVLGAFISTYLYCLLVLRTVRGGDNGDEFVPFVSVTLALVFAIRTLGVLIYFIHHISLTMQAEYIIADVAKDLFNVIERLFPEGFGQGANHNLDEKYPTANIPADFSSQAKPVNAENSGYLQAIDDQALLKTAKEHDLILKIAYRPGHFVMADNPLVHVYPPDKLDQKIEKTVRKAFILGRQRTHTQDVEFAIEQLVEVAIRSLSTGINDPFTVISCIDWLGAALTQLVQKPFPSPYRFDDQKNLRVIFEHILTFKGVTDVALNQIRQYSEDSVAVRIRLLETIEMVLKNAQNDEMREVLYQHARMIEAGSRKSIDERKDRTDITERYRKIKEQK